jgi:uncharacterized glyoxalase superfamily protein PhnB
MHARVGLGFNGRCAAAVRFDRDAVGAEVQMRHRDSPDPPPPGMPIDRIAASWMVVVPA